MPVDLPLDRKQTTPEQERIKICSIKRLCPKSGDSERERRHNCHSKEPAMAKQASTLDDHPVIVVQN